LPRLELEIVVRPIRDSFRTVRPHKITFAEMRESGVRRILVYSADYRCSHSIAISGEP
jgi:hypothetical protein